MAASKFKQEETFKFWWNNLTVCDIRYSLIEAYLSKHLYCVKLKTAITIGNYVHFRELFEKI